MSLVEVACPGCRAPLKAPPGMAGKKARCKKCNTPFRIPGGTGADAVGDSQALSAADPPPGAPPAEEVVPAALPVEDDEPLAASVAEDDEPLAAVVAEEPAPADPFAFATAPPEPKKKERKPRGKDDTPVPPEPAASADPFAFTSAPAEPPAKKKKEPERKPRDEDDEAPPAPAASGDPFAFGSAPAPAEKSGRRPRGDKSNPKAPAARPAPAGGGGLVKVVVGAAVFAVLAGGIVAGTLVFLSSNKPAEVAKTEKKDEKKVEPPSNEPAPAPVGKTEPTAKDQAKGNRATGGTPQKGAGAKGKVGAYLVLPPGKQLAFPPKPAAPKPVTEPASNPVPVAVPFADARRFFPPGKADADLGVLWRSTAGFQGVGEKVTLSLFSPNTGKETAKVEVDHDGTPDPAADVSVDGGTFAHGHRTTGKVTVWDVRKKTKKLDAFDPYADKPEHRAAKLAAVYLTEPPDRVVTVTTAGAVHVWDVATKALAGEYVPAKAAAGKVAGGRGVAPLPTRRGVVVAVGGVIYKVDTAGAVAGAEVDDLGGDVGRSLALGMSPAGKVLYAFETDADGKRERAVMQLAGGSRSPALRWPADAGEPVAAAWAGDTVASLATSQGAAVWFDADGGFNPIAVARTPDDKAVHAVAGTDSHWSLLPSPADPKGSVAVELALPPQGVGDPLTPAARRPVAALVLDLKGLSQ